MNCPKNYDCKNCIDRETLNCIVYRDAVRCPIDETNEPDCGEYVNGFCTHEYDFCLLEDEQ